MYAYIIIIIIIAVITKPENPLQNQLVNLIYHDVLCKPPMEKWGVCLWMLY